MPSEALARARAGDGPTLIEAKSYRITRALGGDEDRPAARGGARRSGGLAIPILRLSRHLRVEAGVDEARIEEIETQARADVDAAVEFALASPRPGSRRRSVEDVYAPADWNTPGRLS